MKITVTGSLGNISKPLAQQLIKDGYSVTIISSDENKQVQIEALGAIAAIGSIEDVAFLTQAFSGADAVYTMVPPNLTTNDMRAYYVRIGSNYATAIKATGIKQVVLLSSMGAHLEEGTGPILGIHDVEAIFNRLTGVNITYLRPSFFYTNFFNYVPMIKGMGILGDNFGDTDRVIFVSPKDIATAAADALEHPVAGKQIRYVVSDEYTGNEAAAILGKAIGNPELKWLRFSDADTLQGLQQAGLPQHASEKFVEMGQAARSGALWQDYDLHKAETFKGITKLEDFAREFAQAFN